jgi:hypothetical protein
MVSGQSRAPTALRPGKTRYQLYSRWLGTMFCVHFENITVFLLVKWKYQIPSKKPTKYLRIFLVFGGPSKQMLK